MQNRSPQLSGPIPAKPASGRWRRFWRPSTVSGDRQTEVGNLPWRDLLNRRDALILDIGPARAAGHSDVLQIALIDTTGAARFAARFAAEGTSAEVVPWSRVHDPLVRALEGAGVVLAWDAPSKVRLLARTARKHGLPPPTVPWRDLRAEYRRLGYLNDSLTTAARLHSAGGVIPGPLASCYRTLAVMDACSN
ncbi:MAG: hypothetical protein OXG74_12485 [Acidobacteria bacterium]|nr:hypothetical protein [Acidobacteriota bacterium]